MIQQAIIDQQIQKDVASLLEVYTEAETEIIKAIQGKNLWRDSERLQMLKQIQKIIEQLEIDSVNTTTPLFQKNYDEAQKIFDEALKEAQKLDPTIKPDAKKAFQKVSEKNVEFVVAGLAEITTSYIDEVRLLLNGAYWNISSSLNLVKKDIRKELIKEYGKAEITGKSRDKLSRELIAKLQKQGITGFKVPSDKTKSGDINLSLKAYVQGLTQSTMITTRSSAVIKRALETGNDLLKISTHSNPSRMCAKWQGVVVSISGQNKKYSSLSEATFNKDYKRGGIFHRWCRHNLYVYFER